jgi:hypothetical protein
MSSAVSAWQALTESERKAWIVLAQTERTPNRVGQMTERAGYQLFIDRKVGMRMAGSMLNPAPYKHSLVGTCAISFSNLTETSIRLSLDQNSYSSRARFYLMMSPPVSSGVMSPNTPRYTKIFLNNATDLPNDDYINVYQNVFGSLSGTAGMKIFLKVVVVLIDIVPPGSVSAVNSGLRTPQYFHDSAVIQSP